MPEFENVINNINEQFRGEYEVTDNCLYRLTKNKNGEYDSSILCNFIPIIVNEIMCDDGSQITRKYEISGIDKDGELLKTVTVNESDFDAMKWVRQNWGTKCNIAPAPCSVNHIRYVLQETASWAELKHLYLSTGWHRINGRLQYLMPGDKSINVELDPKLSDYGFNRDCDKELLIILPQMIGSIAPVNVMYPLMAYTFLCPLNHMLKQAGFEPKTILMLLGKTGSKKSTLSALFLSFFGKFQTSSLPLSFRDTSNSMEVFLYYLKDNLTVIDDYHPQSGKEKQKYEDTMQILCRGFGNRVGRGRLDNNCELREVKYPRGNAIITSEMLPSVGESATARFIPVRINADEINNKELTLYQGYAAEGKLSACMFMYTEFLREHFLYSDESEKLFIRQLKNEIKANRKMYKEISEKYSLGLRDRLIDDLSILRISAKYFLLFLFVNGVIENENLFGTMILIFDRALIELGSQQQNITSEDQPTHIFIRTLQTLIDNKKVTLVDRSLTDGEYNDQNFVGYYDNENYYFEKSLAYKAVKDFCRSIGDDFIINNKSLREALNREGISICDEGMNVKKFRVKEKTFRYVCIPKDVMREIADEEEQENKIPEAQEFFSNRKEFDARISETLTAIKNFEGYKDGVDCTGNAF